MFYKLLFISYKFVKGFLAITFPLLGISSWNFQDVCQRETTFQLDPTNDKDFAYRPSNIKKSHFVTSCL